MAATVAIVNCFCGIDVPAVYRTDSRILFQMCSQGIFDG